MSVRFLLLSFLLFTTMVNNFFNNTLQTVLLLLFLLTMKRLILIEDDQIRKRRECDCQFKLDSIGFGSVPLGNILINIKLLQPNVPKRGVQRPSVMRKLENFRTILKTRFGSASDIQSLFDMSSNDIGKEIKHLLVCFSCCHQSNEISFTEGSEIFKALQKKGLYIPNILSYSIDVRDVFTGDHINEDDKNSSETILLCVHDQFKDNFPTELVLLLLKNTLHYFCFDFLQEFVNYFY